LAAAAVNRLLPFCLCVLAAARLARPADLVPHDVLAHGNDERFWVARVSATTAPQGGVRTTIDYRLFGQDTRWQQATVVPARVMSLASQGAVATLLLEDGTWMLLYPDASDPITAGGLPGGSKMMAIAGGRGSWWAIGLVNGGMPAVAPATRPAATEAYQTTRPSVRAQVPATRPQPKSARFVLFRLSGNDWTPMAEVPDPPGAVPAAALTVADSVPFVANLDAAESLRVRRLDNERLVDVKRLDQLPPVASFKLLGHVAPPRLWVQPQAGSERLYVLDSRNLPPLELPPINGAASRWRTVALAFGGIRMVAEVGGKVWEQDFNIDSGAPGGPAYVLAAPRPSPLVIFQTLQTLVVTAALVIVVLGSFRQSRRAGMRAVFAKLDQISLAPLRLRLLAGLIDASPVVLAVGAAAVRLDARGALSDQNQEWMLALVYCAAGLFYVLFTTLVESLTGRSVGKMITNLRVIGLDGGPATTGALVARNLLRLIDVGLFFFPLVMVMLFPLRQRAGDVAAGTLVVMGAGAGSRGPESNEAQEISSGNGPQKK